MTTRGAFTYPASGRAMARATCMPCNAGAAEPPASSSIATVRLETDATDASSTSSQLCMVSSRQAPEESAGVEGADVQHTEYARVCGAPTEEGAPRHGKARRRYESGGRLGPRSKVERPAPIPEHFAPMTRLPAASAPREAKASTSGSSGTRPKARAWPRKVSKPRTSVDAFCPKAIVVESAGVDAITCAIVPFKPNELTPPTRSA